MAILSVMVDTREPAWVQALTFGGVPTVSVAIDAGDLQVATDDNKILVIERKTPEDLLNTLKADRLFPQCTRMLEVSRWSYIVVTGTFECSPLGKVITKQDQVGFSNGNGFLVTRETGWAWESLQGALLTVQEMGIGIVYAASDESFERTVIRLAARDRGNVPVTPPRLPEVIGPGKAIIASLPGIGIERMRAVLRFTGTPAWALTWLTELDSDEKVPGINIGTKRAIRQALGLDAETKLSVIALSDGAY